MHNEIPPSQHFYFYVWLHLILQEQLTLHVSVTALGRNELASFPGSTAQLFSACSKISGAKKKSWAVEPGNEARNEWALATYPGGWVGPGYEAKWA